MAPDAASGATLAASGRSFGRSGVFQVGPEGPQVAPGVLKSVLGGTKWSLGASLLAPWGAQVGPGSLPSGSLDCQVGSGEPPKWLPGAPKMPKRIQNGFKIDSEIAALIALRSEYFLEGT